MNYDYESYLRERTMLKGTYKKNSRVPSAIPIPVCIF